MSSDLSTNYYIISDTSNCVSYEPSAIDIFFPSPVIFSKLFCVSTDRTILFLVSLVRLLFYVILYEILNDLINFEKHYIIKVPFMLLIFINIVYIGVVVSKPTIFSIGSQSPVAVAKPYNF